MSKRIFAFLMTIVLVFSMSPSVFAYSVDVFFRNGPENNVYENVDKTGWRINVSLDSNAATREKLCLFYVLYDENNRMMSLETISYQAGFQNSDKKIDGKWWSGKSGSFQGLIKSDVYPDRYPATLKVFAWPSLTSIYPVSNCLEYVFLSAPSNKAIIIKDMQGFIAKLTENEYTGNTADIVDIMVEVGTEVYESALALGETEDLDIEQLKIDYSGSRAQLSNIYHNLMGEQERVRFQNKILEVAGLYKDLKDLMMDIFNISI